MFAFDSVQALRELAAARPQAAPLFEEPLNSHSFITSSPTIGENGFLYLSQLVVFVGVTHKHLKLLQVTEKFGYY